MQADLESHGSPGRAHALWFVAPRHAELREEEVPEPGANEVTVRALASLVSAGTEMLVYRGEAPRDADLVVETARGSFALPAKYAYQVVGEVVRSGPGSGYQQGDRVFAIHPHQDLFTMSDGPGLSKVPTSIPLERVVFRNLLEVALTCHLDVPVRHGDCVVVYGQGIVGSFCAQLARRTAGRVIVVDPLESRRELARRWGADIALDPSEDVRGAVRRITDSRGADISIEASGAPQALQSAVMITGKEGTIAVVSFYGEKQVPLILAPEFHYGRQRIVSSMVGSVPAALGARWTRQRRTSVAHRLLEQDWLLTPELVSIPFARAPEAYQLLDGDLRGIGGVLLTYPSQRAK